MTVACFTSLSMCHGLSRISVVSFLAVMTVSAGSEVSTLEAHATAYPTRQFVQLHVEPTSFCMFVAVTRFAFVRIANSGPGPGPVEMERLAPFAVSSGGVVLAVAYQRAPGT